jgi:hypothetical protein
MSEQNTRAMIHDFGFPIAVFVSKLSTWAAQEVIQWEENGWLRGIVLHLFLWLHW